MPAHDPLRFATELAAKLAARSRHVCTFLGAGTSRACGLPDIAQLQTRLLARLNENASKAFQKQLEKRNLEQALSRLRRIGALLADDETVDELGPAEASSLDKTVCQAIVQELAITASTDLAPVKNLSAWVARARYHLPLEIFTVNYDLLIETGLESRRVPYFDGFVGNLRARFHTELVESTVGKDDEAVPSFFARLWKLHGSINWEWDEKQIVRLGQPIPEGLAAAIYPSDAKYEESRRVPFVVLQDRLRRALHQPETLVIIAGYSFGDQHLNELLFEAASMRQRSEFVAFCYSTIPDALATPAMSIPNLQVVGDREAILGGIRANWTPPISPPSDLWGNDKFILGDFKRLAAYLARSAGESEPLTNTAAAQPVQAAPMVGQNGGA